MYQVWQQVEIALLSFLLMVSYSMASWVSSIKQTTSPPYTSGVDKLSAFYTGVGQSRGKTPHIFSSGKKFYNG